ncbi:COMM domain-containing protein 5-like [Styela clava]
MPADIERTSFIGVSVPTEVKVTLKHLNKIEDAAFSGVLEVVRLHLINNNKNIEEEFENCCQKHGHALVMEIYPGLLKLVQSAVRLPRYSLTTKDFLKDLTDLNVPKKYHNTLQDIVFGCDRESIDDMCMKKRPRYPTLNSFRWRVDVGISTASLNRVLEPTILMEMDLKDGKKQSFEVSKEKFHELRYAVAYVLKQMQQLEKRSVLQIKS